jgi:hypothetical protein
MLTADLPLLSSSTLNWWLLMCVISVVNVLAWAATAVAMRRRHAQSPAALRAAIRLQLLLSAVYVAGCAYRSVLPVFDVQRLSLFDTWWSSVIVGRSVATLAELCFALQWALLLRRLAQDTGSALAHGVSRMVVPLIVTAELCSWHAVLTTSNLGHVIEESLWGLCAALLVVSLVGMWPRVRQELRAVLALCGGAGTAYVIYMFGVDVPMYWARWLADQAQGRQYLSVSDGLLDASTRWVVSHRWVDWQSEVVWMTLYFSVAVWLSIGLVHAPLHRRPATVPVRS